MLPGWTSGLVDSAAGWVRSAASATAGALSPAHVFIPGGAATVEATNKAVAAAGAGAENVGTGAGKALSSASDGVRNGLTIVVVFVLLVGAAYVWRSFRRATE